MKTKTLIFICICSISFSSAGIPLSNTPSWISIDNDYSTGGALYDVTMDGWIDYCTGNGNDMASNTNAIYINNSGVLETNASWRSHESGYFSHIYIGDVDKDGFPDMAVSYLGFGIGSQGPTTIYRNNGTGFDTSAWWISSDEYNSFDCAFGDVDLDADLDLAVIAGDAYTSLKSPTRVYRNNNGTFETTPYWTSTDSTPGNACRWVDLNNDGYLDLVVAYRHKLAVFSNINGTLEIIASWSTTEPGWILRIAVGDYNKDGYKDVAVASNGQLGSDSSRIEIYKNNGGSLQTPPEYVMLTGTNYCSCVEWADANNDGWLDLAAGGWWEPVVVFENNTGVINTTPAWSWTAGSNLVCETVMWGDVRNNSLTTISDYKSGDSVRKLFYFDRHPIQSLQEVRVNDTPVPISDFTYDPLTGWISFINAPGIGSDNIEITYTYAQYPDLGVTNWVSATGNYLFYSTASLVTEEEQSPVAYFTIYPNPFTTRTKIRLSIGHSAKSEGRNAYGVERSALKIYDIAGKLVKSFSLPTAYGLLPTSISWDGTDNLGKKLPNGIYFAEARIGNTVVREKIIIVK